MGRWRYLLLEELSGELPGGEVFNALKRSIVDLFGHMGLMEASPRLLYARGRYSVIRCPRGEVDRIRASLIFLSDGLGRPIAARIKSVSGTLRGLRVAIPSGGGAGGPRARGEAG
jgi:RNase P/RNase MRP subunit POP5